MQKKVWGTLVLLLGQSLWADITLPKIFDSHMVLQRQAKVPVWGLADAGEVVEVHFSGQSKKTVADSTGRWEVQLDPMAANSNPQTMSLNGKNEITLEDILVGEVWLASGQSNMEWAIRGVAPEELKAAEELLKKTQVRVFHVTHHITSIVPLYDTIGQWKLPTELASKKDTTAVGYFFAEKLQQELGIPIGILDSNWGGTRIECFISDDGYELTNLTNPKTNPGMIKNQILAMKQGLENAKKTIDQAEKGVFIPFDNNDALNWGQSTNGLYNAMIAPLAPYAIKGAIWYQGESNRGAKDYFEKLKALSAGWSKAFRVKDIPLYLVQIAPYHEVVLEIRTVV
jgi:sialate O-acetylesterase